MLEFATLGWNVVGVGVVAVLALSASSVALVGFAMDSLIEIGASVVVIWELSGAGDERQHRALRLIGIAFVALAGYLFVQSSVALVTRHHAHPGLGAIAWTALTAVVMFALAGGKHRTGLALRHPVLTAEARVTFIDAILAVAVLVAVMLNDYLGWWWADALAGYLIVFYALREAREIFIVKR